MIDQLLRCHPYWQTEIEWRLKKDLIFQEIVSDYKKVTSTMLYWQHSSDPNSVTIAAEYFEIQQELIMEAIHYLQHRNPIKTGERDKQNEK